MVADEKSQNWQSTLPPESKLYEGRDPVWIFLEVSSVPRIVSST